MISKDGQDKIYFITASNLTTAKNSPHLEVFRKNDIEVLLLTDDVDEIAVMHLAEFDGHSLQSVSKGDLDLSGLITEEATDNQDKLDEETLTEKVKTCLGDRVKEVRMTQRLTDSPSCLVADENEMSAHLGRLLRSSGQQVPDQKPIMELNGSHGLVRILSDETNDERFADWVHVLFDQALLSEGGQLEDPSAFVRRLNNMFANLYQASK